MKLLNYRQNKISVTTKNMAKAAAKVSAVAATVGLGALGALGILVSQSAQADQFHYNNLIIGDRAVGLGGSFGAVADDASGVFYNPAGLGFAVSNDVSGSANAFYSRKVVYKKALGTLDFIENSSGTAPSFFGILQKLDHVSKGLVFAFGLFTTDSELKDQDDLIENASLAGGVTIPRYHRTVNVRGSTSYTGLALSKRVSSSLSFGFGINYVQIDELVQEYQDVRVQGVTSDGSPSSIVIHRAQNIRQHLTGAGIQPVLGVQWAFAGRFSMGLTVKGGSWLNSKLDYSSEKMDIGVAAANSDVLSKGGVDVEGNPTVQSVSFYQLGQDIEKEDALGAMPGDVRFGFAWFASTRAMVTFDVNWIDAVNDAHSSYQKDLVINYSTGLEYYVMPEFALRMGVFTNNDARSVVDHKKGNQRDHIDYIGESIVLAWIQPTMQIAGGFVLQQGTGEAQKAGGTAVQTIDGNSRTFTFSISNSI